MTESDVITIDSLLADYEDPEGSDFSIKELREQISVALLSTWQTAQSIDVDSEQCRISVTTPGGVRLTMSSDTINADVHVAWGDHAFVVEGVVFREEFHNRIVQAAAGRTRARAA